MKYERRQNERRKKRIRKEEMKTEKKAKKQKQWKVKLLEELIDKVKQIGKKKERTNDRKMRGKG